MFSLLWLPIVRSALAGVVFCLDFWSFLFSSLVPLPGVFPLFIYYSLGRSSCIPITKHWGKKKLKISTVPHGFLKKNKFR
jgi:hypothetical protein